MTTEQRKVLKQALKALYAVQGHVCEAAHHARRDQHKLGEPCPVEKRHDETIEVIKNLLDKIN